MRAVATRSCPRAPLRKLTLNPTVVHESKKVSLPVWVKKPEEKKEAAPAAPEVKA